MPTVLRSGPYRFFFYSHDRREPLHIHVERDACTAKFWITPVALASNIGFPPTELVKLRELVERHEQELRHAWTTFFAQDR